MRRTKMQSILDSMMGDLLGGDINSDATIVTENAIEFHYWNGERFMMTRQPSGCAYNTNTGDLLDKKTLPAKRSSAKKIVRRSPSTRS